MQISVYIATSLDGFIARLDDDLTWLDEASANVPKGEDMGYSAFMASVDVLVMGRKTYEKVLSFGVDWPYEKHVIVLSSQNLTIAENLYGKVSLSNEAPSVIAKRLKAQGVKRVYLDGGETIRRFLRAGLVTDMCITQVPVMLGSGKPLFLSEPNKHSNKDPNTGAGQNPSPELSRWQLIDSRSYEFGFVQSTWALSHEPAE